VSFTWGSSVAAFEDAAAGFVATAARVGDRWEQPGLGEWDVRALVGHTSRSFLTVEAYLAVPAERADLESAVAYYEATRALSVGPEVAARGRAAGAALGDEPARAVTTIAERVVPLVREHGDGSALLTTIAGGMRLADYLPTRTFELVVHTLDLAVALDLPLDVPPAAVREAFTLVTDLAVEGGAGGPLLLALTGRRPLPAGFTLL
jgi:uncharacterized protein (TIGR03083 family)